jgi:S-adenosylmethionine:tRNA ribosyltransferase-isomerase
MRKPEKIPIEKYDYPLPDERIAKYPLDDRDASKVLVYRPGKIGQKQDYEDQSTHEQKQFSQEHKNLEEKHSPRRSELTGQEPNSHAPEVIEQKQFFQVPELLEKGDRLYFNATRVVQARLIFRKSTGARIEIFCLEPFLPADHQLAFSSTGPVEFVCLIGNSKKWKEGTLTKNLGELLLTAEISGRQDDKFIVRFSWNDPGTSFSEILERSGSTPIPPYLNREAEARDAATYQTVYARQDGSVAAPTAGLHFTDSVLAALDQKGVRRHELVLHVGAGTFIPVKEENAVNHPMHAELVTVERSLLESLLTGDRKIAVGTTTTRSLESIYWLGVKAISNTQFSFENLCLDQWDAYTIEDEVPLEKAFRALLKKMDDADIDAFSFHTRLMITPGYRFRVIGGLFTNFHQPKSTLLLLIAAVAGDDWRKIYDFALENEFRFLSYGDSSLLFL